MKRSAIFAALTVAVIIPAYAKDLAPQAWVRPVVSLEFRDQTGPIKTVSDIEWRVGATVLEVMQSVEGLKFSAEWFRSFNDWLVLSIDGKANQPLPGPNWTFCVNGIPAAVGPGAYRVGPGNSIVWVYGTAYPPDCK